MIQPAMFADVVSCESCPSTGKLLRDRLENVPQPGFTGSNYSKSRVLLTGQNPGVPPPRMLDADKRYTAALRALRDRPSTERQREFDAIVREFVPTWPVHGAYFPLQECGLTLDDIAYCNVVRCRTVGNATPSESVARECVMRHFERWLDVLQPRVVVFVGKWASDHAADAVRSRGIPSSFMNRRRDRSATDRAANRAQVAALVRGVLMGQG
jgi:hypothetical protein